MATSLAEKQDIQGGTESIYTRRATYHSRENNFEFSWAPVPAHQFVAARDRALDPSTPTGLIPLDLGPELEVSYAATTPIILARYLKVRQGESLSTQFDASGSIYYVIDGQGTSTGGDDCIEWGTGDLFCFPGGQEISHQTAAGDCLLFCATDEPLLSRDRLRPSVPEEAIIEAVHWPAQEIERQLEPVLKRPITETTSGHALLFSSRALDGSTNVLQTMNCAINTLEAGRDQRPHRHNGVAVTLCIEGEGVYSLIEDKRVDWIDCGVQITPPAALHSHHNRGTRRMKCLIFQDEALHYYTRTPGFSWT